MVELPQYLNLLSVHSTGQQGLQKMAMWVVLMSCCNTTHCEVFCIHSHVLSLPVSNVVHKLPDCWNGMEAVALSTAQHPSCTSTAAMY
jgi:hypothetical protein